MLKQQSREYNPRKNEIPWILLLFISGSINTTSFISCAQFVTHVTGSITLIGISLANQDWFKFLTACSIPLLFFFGVMIAGYYISRLNAEDDQLRYEKVLEVIGFCLLGVALAGHLKLFEKLGVLFSIEGTLLCLGSLALLSGLQNGAITALSKGALRTTHLTGVVTDVGLGAIDVFISNKPLKQRESDRELLKAKSSQFLAFVLGSLVGAFITMKYGYLSLLLPSILAFFLIGYSRYAVIHSRLGIPGDQPGSLSNYLHSEEPFSSKRVEAHSS